MSLGQILAFDYMCKMCRKCTIAEEKVSTPTPHDCRRNCFTSSKMMEPEMAFNMLKQLDGKGFHVQNIAMNNVSTAIAGLKQDIDSTIERSSDVNHIKKGFTDKLYELKQVHNYKELRNNNIKYLERLFLTAIKSNHGNDEAIAESLQAIMSNVFGDHLKCLP